MKIVKPNINLAQAISNNLIRSPCYEINADALLHLKNNDIIRIVSKLFTSVVSDTDMSHLPDFLRDMDQMIERYRNIDSNNSEPGELPEPSTMLVSAVSLFSGALSANLLRK